MADRAAHPALAVQRGRASDLNAVADLAAKVLPGAGDASSLAAFLEGPAGRLWVASTPAGISGFLMANRVADELEILWMGVARTARRHGLGRALIETAAGEAPPALALCLEVRAGNHRARAFYSSLGFREEGVRRAYYPGGEDALRLVRP